MNSNSNRQKTINGNITQSEDLVHFVKAYLQYHGAYLEQRHQMLEAVLPQPLAMDLGYPDYIQIGLDSQEEADQAYQLSFGSPILDALVSHATQDKAIVFQGLQFHYIKSAGFERLISEAFTFHGAIFSVGQTATTHSNYLMVACHYVAQSDEQKQGVFFPAINLETGAFLPDLHHHLSAGEINKSAVPPPSLSKDQRTGILKKIKLMIPTYIEKDIESFVASMNRRYARDVKNLNEYYESLESEMCESLKHPGLSQESIQDRQEKIALIPAEAIRKKEDLLKKYSIRVKIFPIAALRLSCPVVKISCKLKFGRKDKDLYITYNPVLKKLEPYVCPVCDQSGYEICLASSLKAICPACDH